MNKIILSGALGSMGRVCTDFFKDSDVEIICGIDLKEDNLGYPVYSKLDEIPKDILSEADCILDFSTASFFPKIIEFAADNNLPIVVATTGLTEEDRALASKLSQKIAIVLSSNFSVGINTIVKVLEPLTQILGADYDIEIVEKHHNKKIDAPSGTAMTMAETIRETLPEDIEYVYDRHEHGARKKNEIGISAIRGGTIPGEHTVIFAGEDEIVEIKHTALSKKIFAAGALKAINWVVKQPPGLYDMQNILFENE